MIAFLVVAADLSVADTVRADERVPMIATHQLPAVGTIAPIETQDVTHVRVGLREDIRWFAVTGVEGVVDYQGLVKVLTQRAGTRRPSPHGVWLTATSAHAWAHVLVLVKACLEAGIYRVGVRVRSDAGADVGGFPLFVPSGSAGGNGPRAGQLTVRVDALHPKEAKGGSDVGHIYAAAQRALERRADFGVEQLVGRIWISPNTPLQYALTAIDLLYRGGCVGVRVQLSLRSSWRGLDVVPVVEIQGGVASRLPQTLEAPPVRPRTAPWGIDGANAPGWVDLDIVDLPAIDAPVGGAAAKRPEVRPNYAADPAGVPADVMRAADAEIRLWGGRLGTALLAAVRSTGEPARETASHFAVATRRKDVLPDLLAEARRAFPDASRVVPSAQQFSAFLFDQGRLLGRADVTLAIAGDAVRVIFATWTPLEPNASITLVPFGVDPFAGGEAAAFRVWMEGLLHGMRTRGAAAVPLAGRDHVLPYLPAVAHAGTQRALDARTASVELLARSLRTLRYDRVVLAPQTGTATVLADARVVGVLTVGAAAEEGTVRVRELSPRRAP
ncbi:MAG: hypothetical protein O2894_09340 [Planctomycetota bacterium]|nr:hypothetical protein [Planctomycetota bacterium]